MQERHILDNSNLFVWDGKQVDGEVVRTGEVCEPVLLKVTYPRPEGEMEDEEGCSVEGVMEERGKDCEIEIGRPKDSTLGDLRVCL